MSQPSSHPAHLGPALLYHLKQGKPVERITVYLTHENIHAIHAGNVMDNQSADICRKIQAAYPLEITLAPGQDMEKVIDCRLFEVPWHIDIRTKEQKKKGAIVPTLTTLGEMIEPNPEVRQAIVELFEPSRLRSESEYLLLQRAQRRELIRQARSQPPAPPPVEDTAHAR